jgi:hypothetical protein
MTILAPAASASPSDQHDGNPTAACNGTHHSDTGHGANVRGAYDETCDGSPSGNGNGGGNATGKPCAGCVGNADDKNPPGQAVDGSDHNAGYECDRNHGVGRTNPAHTGCLTAASEPAPSGVGGSGGHGNGLGGNGNGNGSPSGRPSAPKPKPGPAVDGSVNAPGTTSGIDPSASVVPPATDALSVDPGGSTVMGLSLLRAPDEVARALASTIGSEGSELPRTGGNGPDLLLAGLALVALGTTLVRAGRPARGRSR